MGSLLITKKDAVTGAPISDVEFLVTNSDGGVIGNANGKFVTDSAGTIRIDGLGPARPSLSKDQSKKDGYLLDDTPQTIKIKANETMTVGSGINLWEDSSSINSICHKGTSGRRTVQNHICRRFFR